MGMGLPVAESIRTVTISAVAAQESGTDPLDEQADPHADAVLTNERVGRFALWRYKGEG